MKKTALCILVLVCIFLCSGCKTTTEVKDMKEEFIIDGTIVTVRVGKFFFTEMNTGKTEEVLIEEYNKPVGGTDIVSDGNHIYLFENGEWKKLDIEGFEIWNKPLKIDKTVFFVAEDPSNAENTDLYVWKYEVGKVEKLSEDKIWYHSGLLTFDDNLIYCRWRKGEYGPNEITRYNIYSGKKEHIADGDCLCWKEEGKSFFFSCYGESGLVLYDIESETKTMVNEELIFEGPPIYNRDNGVMLVVCDDPKGTPYDVFNIYGILYPENDDFVYWDSYAEFMDSYFDDDISESLLGISFSETYWN